MRSWYHCGGKFSQGGILAVTTSRLDDWRQTVPTFVNSEFSRALGERGLAGEDRRRLQTGLDRIVDLLRYDLHLGGARTRCLQRRRLDGRTNR